MDPDGRPGTDPERLRRIGDAVRAASGPDGFLPFDRFVEIALHHPTAGFYATRRALGSGGDFYTAAHVHPIFSQVLARRLLEEFGRLGRPARFRVTEVGPGDGTLAKGLLTTLRAALPPSTVLTYVLVEPSEGLRDTLADRLDGSPNVRFAESLGADGPFNGAVIANELLDALPFRRVIRRGASFRELGVRWSGDRWEWAEGPEAQVPAPALPEDTPEGTILELSPMAEGFVREISDHLESGVAVLLDYGAEASDLVHGRPSGTLAAVRDHHPVDDPLEDPGSADLSAFVNFSRIRHAATRSGLHEIWYGPQREALARWGIEAAIRDAVAAAGTPEAEVKVRLAAKSLLFGFENFQVLELSPSPAR